MAEKIVPPSAASAEEMDTRAMMRATMARVSTIAILGVASTILLAVAVFMMVPLKRSVPYVVQVNHATGQVTVPGSTAAVFVPSWANKSFFLRRWIKDMFTINRYLTIQIDAPRAQYFIRGRNAIAEYNAFRDEDKTFDRLAADPTLVRNVDILSIDPVAGAHNGVVAQVLLTTVQKGAVSKQTLLVTLYYVIIPPDTMSEMERDPIGIYVTDFKIAAAATPGQSGNGG